MIVPVTKPEEQIDNFVAEGGARFFSEGILGRFRPEVFRKNWEALIKAGIGRMWLLKVDDKALGGIGCIISEDLNDGEKIVTEAFWYVVPELRGSLHGIRLYEEVEDYAKSIGAKRIIMVHYQATMDERLSRFYKAKGYVLVETTYVKEL